MSYLTSNYTITNTGGSVSYNGSFSNWAWHTYSSVSCKSHEEIAREKEIEARPKFYPIKQQNKIDYKEALQ